MTADIDDAIRKRKSDELVKLLKKEAIPTTNLLPSLNLAIKENYSEAVKILVEHDQQLVREDKSESPLITAARHGGPAAIIDVLLSAGCDINTRHKKTGKTALIVAAGGGFADTAEALLSVPECEWDAIGNPPTRVNRIDEFHSGQTALMEAIGLGNKGAPVVEVLLRKGANPNITASTQLDGEITPLMQAAMHGLTGIVEMLLNAGVEVDKTDDSSQTALHWAVKGANLGMHTETDVIKPLIQAGADLNAVSDCGGDHITPVLRACDIGDFRGPVAHDMAQVLIEAGSDVNRRDMYGKTILHRAVSYGWLDIMDMVIDRGADLTILDHSGHSIIYDVADSYGVNIEAFKKLLDRNCDVQGTYTYLAQCNICIPNSTLMDVAMQQGNLALIPYLRAAGSPSPNRLPEFQHRVTMQDKTFVWLSDVTTQPLTLKEWGRIGLRRAIPVGCNLQAALSGLPLPSELVKYTLLKTGVDLSGVDTLTPPIPT